MNIAPDRPKKSLYSGNTLIKLSQNEIEYFYCRDSKYEYTFDIETLNSVDFFSEQINCNFIRL